MYARDRGMENRLSRLSRSAYVARRNVYTRALLVLRLDPDLPRTLRATKERPYCLNAARFDDVCSTSRRLYIRRPRLLVVLCHSRRKRPLRGLSLHWIREREREIAGIAFRDFGQDCRNNITGTSPSRAIRFTRGVLMCVKPRYYKFTLARR